MTSSLPKFKNDAGRDENADLWALLRQSQLRVSKFKKPANMLGDEDEEEEKKFEFNDYRRDREKNEVLDLVRLSSHRYSVGSYQDMLDEDKEALDNLPELDLDLKVFSSSDEEDDEDVSDIETGDDWSSEEESVLSKRDGDEVKGEKRISKKSKKKSKKSSKAATDDEEGTKKKRVVRNRVEKKNRKLMMKLGMKRITGVHRATFKTKKGIFFIDDPDVYSETDGKNTELVIFGQTFVQDTPDVFDQTMTQNMHDVQRLMVATDSKDYKNEDGTFHTLPPTTSTLKKKEVTIVPATEEGEKGLEPIDVELVMSQASVSRSRAVNALRKNNKDVVDAIMWLQS
mmetsp:Transcript_3658/g.4230  ORF Transcript_3658/g.4230 Transcript_3658/m.4230 type:complete len:342 (-) Transcript_3658:208-1233(-)|eukprot:CAMPEP_0194139208 /NCGR_PEP_ID=MMETSP0152-20130528/8920_1 /TAXON_ID=1049557 /ORGANISM="Thalassiothrix antarctica, Strain L6-D1" /LENGTH=341 /DNA_ID=CAMNT_0038836985 /DNA_START=41 /DNA_END=1066 /DNA_ORIENTATION=-